MAYSNNLYGEVLYGQDTIPQEELNAVTPDLLSYLPLYYLTTSIMAKVLKAAADEIGLVNYNVADLLKQCFVETATWGLVLWERFLGLEVVLDKPIEQRRERIVAKLRGAGTCNKEMLIAVAAAFSGGEVEVIEHNDENSFEVKFVGVRGIPQNMNDLSDAIDEIKPAHLTYLYHYTYAWWQELRDTDRPWSSFSGNTWEQLRSRFY